MTPGEVIRSIESKIRIKQLETKEKATYDYILATLIVKGVSITLGDKSNFPTIQEVYPNVFDDIAKEQEDKLQQQRNELSTLRFKQFAQSYNDRFKNKEVPK